MPKGVYQRKPKEVNFWARVNRKGPVHPVLKTCCWEWTGSKLKCKNGNYGLVFLNGKSMLAHRYSYSEKVGPIPEGLNVCHHCDNPSCVRPSHLFVGDNRANAADRDAKGRQVIRRGEEFTHAKLTDDIVREIRRRYVPKCPKNGARAMSREFEVSHVVVRWVIHRKIWRHVR